MLVHEYAAQLAQDTDKARESSLALWGSFEAASGGRWTKTADAIFRDRREIVSLDLVGRYRVGDGNEFPCEIPELSPSGIRIKGPKSGGHGNWCTARVASVGIIEGVVIQARQSSFVLGVIAPPRRLRRLAQRLHWHSLRNNAKVLERRASERIEMNAAKATLETDDGRTFDCEIFDLSDGGAALQLGANALYFWIGQPVRFGERFGRVLRNFPGGLVIKFD